MFYPKDKLCDLTSVIDGSRFLLFVVIGVSSALRFTGEDAGVTGGVGSCEVAAVVRPYEEKDLRSAVKRTSRGLRVHID